jgi:ribosomal 50S subunit-associated protein YjgA (DUF615 family)
MNTQEKEEAKKELDNSFAELKALGKKFADLTKNTKKLFLDDNALKEAADTQKEWVKKATEHAEKMKKYYNK